MNLDWLRASLDALNITNKIKGFTDIQPQLQGIITGDFIISQCAPYAGDQSSRFIDEVLLASSNNKTLILPSGQIDLSGVNAPIAVSNLKLLCQTGVSSLDCMSARYIDLFVLNSGDVDLFGIEFRRWKRPIYSSATLGSFRMQKCRLRQNRDHINLMDRTDYPQSYTEQIIILDNDIIDSPGFEIKSAFESAQVNFNRFNRVRRDPSVWDYLTSHRIYAACMGDHDDAPPELSQFITKGIQMHKNIVRGVENLSNSAVTTNGLVAAGIEVSILGNIVRDINATNNPYDCEGIYIKAAYGEVANNILLDATRQSCSIAVKGKNYGAPLAKSMRVHHNNTRASKADNALGLIVFGSSVDVIVEDNSFDGFSDGAVVVYGSPVRTKVRRNVANDCGGVPFYWACGDITDCEDSDNVITAQRVPTTADRSRLFNPYPDSGTYQMAGHQIKAVSGSINSFTINSGGSGYAVNGKADASCWLQLSGGVGGTGGGAYATFISGVLVSVVPGSAGSGYTVAPTVTVPLTGINGAVVTCTGTQASVSTTLSTGKIVNMSINRNEFRNDLTYNAVNPEANGYECIYISNGDATSGPIIVDGVNCVDNGIWNGSNPFYIIALSISGSSINQGRASGIKMLGANSGRRFQPWRASGTAAIHRFSNYGSQFLLSPAELPSGTIHPQSTFSIFGNRARIFINFSRFTSASSMYIGTITGGQANGAARITKVVPRFVGPALSAASGSPTLSLGIGSNGSNMIASTPITSIATVTSNVDGTPVNDIVAASSDLDIYFTISGGNITSSQTSILCVDVEWTITA